MNPKFALIPAGYKATVLYQQLPRSDYFDFDRSTVATQINKEGYLEEAAIDIPRVSYDLSANGIPSTCPSLLLEPVSTNLITYSEDFSNAYWTKTGASVVSGFTSPDGTTNAFKLVEDTSTGGHKFLNTNIAIAGAATVSFSFLAKAGERNWMFLTDAGIGGTTNTWIDLQNGVFGDIGSAIDSSSIKSLSNGWYRISLSYPAGAVVQFHTALSTGNTIQTYTGNGTSGAYIWGAQLEEATYSTSYIPTSGATVTRAAETCDDAGNASTFNSEQGILYTEIAALVNDSTIRAISLYETVANINNLITIQYDTTSQGVRFLYRQGAASIADFNVVVTDVTQVNKIAGFWKQDDFKLFINGVKVSEQLSGNVAAAGTFKLLAFDSSSLGRFFYGKCKDLRYYDTQGMTDAEITELLTTLTQ